LTASVVLLVLLSPVLLLVALAIRLDSRGPAIYRQRRVGRGMREFTVQKFRSMHVDADPSRHRDYVQALIGHGGPEMVEGPGRLYKLAVDDRITSIGRLLRRFSLDELPQLWNVARGEMSLVGPRPVIPYEVERYPSAWYERFDVKPGMTGLDIEYVRSRSAWLDLKILARTLWVVVLGRGAA
jgi:lipopolysaccharide/colanic/teichoic acid biosynthesis glycosyltransferase